MSGLIDVNVLLDVLLNRGPWAADAREVWRANHGGRFKGHVASTAITNLFYIARRLAGRERAMQCVAHCLAAFDVVPVDASILVTAALLPGDDFEDNVSIRCAVAGGLDLIVTRDLDDFAGSPVPVLTPAALNARLAQSEFD
jgi:predicted nucleic acid-binding protein